MTLDQLYRAAKFESRQKAQKKCYAKNRKERIAYSRRYYWEHREQILEKYRLLRVAKRTEMAGSGEGVVLETTGILRPDGGLGRCGSGGAVEELSYQVSRLAGARL